MLDSAAGIGEVQQARYVLHEHDMHGAADSLAYDSRSDRITIDNGELSRCEPGQEFWQLRARSLLLDREAGRGYASGPSLQLGGVPVFYYPGTVPFPLGDERASGFLAPSFGSTRSGGFDFELPYYLNLAPHYDATLSPRLISDRGLLTSAEFRYLADWSMNTFNFAFLDNDQLHDQESLARATLAGERVPMNPADKRWLVGYQHNGAIGRNWRTQVDYNGVSDQDYFYDLSGSGLGISARTHLNRQARLDYRGEYLQVGLNLQRVQVIEPNILASPLNKPYDRMPQLHFDTGTALGGGFEAGLSGQYTAFDRKISDRDLQRINSDAELQARGALVTGRRLILQPYLAWSVEDPGWFLRLRAAYKHTGYQLDEQATGNDAEPDFGIGLYQIDGGLVFERQRRGGGIQTLEPRLFYVYNQYEDQSHIPLFDTGELNLGFNHLFRASRFAGGDRVGDANRMSFALSSRVYDSQGRMQARFSLGQIRFFRDRRVSLSNPLGERQPRYPADADESPLMAEFLLRAGDHWLINGDVQWSEQQGRVQEGGLQLRYQRGESRLINLAHRRQLPVYETFSVTDFRPATSDRIDPRIRQTDASLVWPIGSRWKALARWNYDHSNERNLESFLGLEYSNCCTTLRVVGREWVDRNDLFDARAEAERGVFLQLTLHGLGDITGGRVSDLLRQEIRGFNPDTW